MLNSIIDLVLVQQELYLTLFIFRAPKFGVSTLTFEFNFHIIEHMC